MRRQPTTRLIRLGLGSSSIFSREFFLFSDRSDALKRKYSVSIARGRLRTVAAIVLWW